MARPPGRVADRGAPGTGRPDDRGAGPPASGRGRQLLVHQPSATSCRTISWGRTCGGAGVPCGAGAARDV